MLIQILWSWLCLQDPLFTPDLKRQTSYQCPGFIFFLCCWLLQVVSREHASSPSWRISEQTEGWSLHLPRQREHSGGFHPFCQVSCHFTCLQCIFCQYTVFAVFVREALNSGFERQIDIFYSRDSPVLVPQLWFCPAEKLCTPSQPKIKTHF